MMPTIQTTYLQAAQKLSDTTPHPILEAQLILAHILQKPRSYILAWPEKELSLEELAKYEACLQRRYLKEPFAYITGTQEFWSLPLSVSKDTLIPRPETELLVETVLSLFAEKAELKCADLGTGSGAIALACAYEKPTWTIHATDISQNALVIASNNAQQLRLRNISFFQGSWCTALPYSDYDVIVSNPPYIGVGEWDEYAKDLSYEPMLALVSGQDGLDAIRMISHTAKNHLLTKGYLLVEHGFSQGELVRQIFKETGYSNVQTFSDLSGLERVTIGQHDL